MSVRLANYRAAGSDAVRAGVVRGDRIFNLRRLDGQGDYGSLGPIYEDERAFEKALAGELDSGEGAALGTVRLLPPSMAPSAIYFAGFNYHDHVANMEKAFGITIGNDPKGMGLKPWHGLKPRNSLCGMGAEIELPTDRVDWEIELAAVIGRAARRVSVRDALDYVAGYSVAIDISARDLALRPHTPVESPARMDWILQKGLEGFCPLGPWLAPAADIKDPQDLNLRLSVNGAIKQDSNTRQMIFSVAEAIAHLSDIVTLSPGDLILTGSPAGVGAETGQFLKPGDQIAAWIETIGELQVTTLPWKAERFY